MPSGRPGRTLRSVDRPGRRDEHEIRSSCWAGLVKVPPKTWFRVVTNRHPETDREKGTETMGAAEDAATVRRAYEAFNTGDMETLTETFDESASWHTPGRGSLAGDQQGREATFAQFGRYVGETGGTFRAELRQVTAADDGRVVGIHHNSGERDGKYLDVDCCLVLKLKDGRITDGREYFFNLHAWDEFWS